MPTIKHILFPYDFSKRCSAAVPFVKALAQHFGARVTLISVVAPLWQATMTDPAGSVPINMEQLQKDLAARLAGALVSELSGIEVERITQMGDPGEQIKEYCNAEGVDLVMMPTHGYGPFRALLLGSVTSKVLHDAECPVWTAAHVEKPEAGSHLPIRRILCAVDGTPKTVPVMQWAADFAKSTGSTLRLVHAVTGVEAWPEHALVRDLEEQLASRARTNLEKQMKSAGIEAPLCLTVGDPSSVVHEEAMRHNADLVVIGRGLLHEAFGRLRTEAYGIIRNAPCPVISV